MLLRVLLHALVLGGIIILAIVVGFGAYSIAPAGGQVAAQVPVAGLVCVGLYALWGLLVRRLASGRAALRRPAEVGWTYAAAFIWSGLLFVPLHLVTQGYLTAFGNILGMWLFQLPFGLFALLAANPGLMVGAGSPTLKGDE